ncbi:vacuolar protein sorting-associated protein 35 [Gregarina niphandrodes]|uniref:Vacuolar protein sorting-associated protein 35 n=1 Tax=Gregarina niphandrodes TaxID=110365 RepID=A0A023B9I3_GRENI|nr:vacuolar protein sorting-associated protein 35 [Gregarina niphandrodes]EZG72962.1 vacuolar protein sorting-associated protein 35 [Gregarina niphandrodes]|eukprot:XP_011129721.1 vacuolar protein sorting-associated protein 35 [Gregarina niphandrodes]
MRLIVDYPFRSQKSDRNDHFSVVDHLEYVSGTKGVIRKDPVIRHPTEFLLMDPEPGDTSLDESYKQIIQGIEAQDICLVLRAAGDALWELRRPGHGPETYHHLYKQVTDILEHVSKWYVQDDFKYRRNILHIYASSQQNGNVVPRLYLMIVAAYAILYRQYIVRCHVRPGTSSAGTSSQTTKPAGVSGTPGFAEPTTTGNETDGSITIAGLAETLALDETNPYSVLKDLICMLNTSQDPLRSLYVRYFATVKMNDIILKIRNIKYYNHLSSWPLVDGQQPTQDLTSDKSVVELRRQKTEKQQRVVNGIHSSAPPSEAPILNEHNVFDFFMAMLIADLKLLTRIEYKYGRGVIGAEVRSKHTFIADEAFSALYDVIESPNSARNYWTHTFAPRLFKVSTRFKNNTTLNYFYGNIIARSGSTRLIMIMDELLLSIFHCGIDSISDLGVLLDQVLISCGAQNGYRPESNISCQDACSTDNERLMTIREVATNIHIKLVETVPDLIHQFTAVEPHRLPKMLHHWVYLVRILSIYARYGISVIRSVKLLLDHMCNPLQGYPSQGFPSQGQPPPPDLSSRESFGKAPPLENGNEHPDTASDLTEVSGADVFRAWESLRSRVQSPVLAEGIADVIKLSIEHHGFVPEVEDFINSILFYFKNDANTYALSILRGLIQKEDISSLCRSTGDLSAEAAQSLGAHQLAGPPRITRILELIVGQLTEECSQSFELAQLAHKVGDCQVPSDDKFAIFAVLRGACEYLKARGVKCPVDLAALCHECNRLVSDVWNKMLVEHRKMQHEKHEPRQGDRPEAPGNRAGDAADGAGAGAPADGAGAGAPADEVGAEEAADGARAAAQNRQGTLQLEAHGSVSYVTNVLAESRPAGRTESLLDFELEQPESARPESARPESARPGSAQHERASQQEDANPQENTSSLEGTAEQTASKLTDSAEQKATKDSWNEDIMESRLGHRYSLKMLIQFLHGCCTDLIDLHADLSFPHLLSAAVLTNQMKGEYTNATYEFVSLAIQVYESSFVNTKYEVRSLQKLTYILYSYIDTIDPQHWNMIM